MPSFCTVLPSPLTFLPEALAVDVVHSHHYICSIPGCLFFAADRARSHLSLMHTPSKHASTQWLSWF